MKLPRYFHLTIKLSLALSLMLSGWLSLTHAHRHVDGHCSGAGAASNLRLADGCGCSATHLHSEPEKGSGPAVPEREDDCQLCRLLADFSATTPMSADLVLDSMVVGAITRVPLTVAVQQTLRVRSRAPPVA